MVGWNRPARAGWRVYGCDCSDDRARNAALLRRHAPCSVADMKTPIAIFILLSGSLAGCSVATEDESEPSTGETSQAIGEDQSPDARKGCENMEAFAQRIELDDLGIMYLQYQNWLCIVGPQFDCPAAGDGTEFHFSGGFTMGNCQCVGVFSNSQKVTCGNTWFSPPIDEPPQPEPPEN